MLPDCKLSQDFARPQMKISDSGLPGIDFQMSGTFNGLSVFQAWSHRKFLKSQWLVTGQEEELSSIYIFLNRKKFKIL